jgi:gamma-glutamylcyclotransferase (GGCT)/AIG2-like uncharacterized protein YtfP
VRIFVYGTLMRAPLRRRLLRRDVPAAAAVLHDWERVRLRGTRYPTLRRRFRGRVEGMVLQVSARGLARLSAYEGPAYRFVRVAVRLPCGNTAAHAWIAPGVTHRIWP